MISRANRNKAYPLSGILLLLGLLNYFRGLIITKPGELLLFLGVSAVSAAAEFLRRRSTGISQLLFVAVLGGARIFLFSNDAVERLTH